MFGFGRKKREREEQLRNSQEKKTEKEYTCLFCKKKFKASEIIFANTMLHPDPEFNDGVFWQTVEQYQTMVSKDKAGNTHGITPVGRRMLDPEKWEVVQWDGDAANGLPLIVRGPLLKSKSDNKTGGDDFGFDSGFSMNTFDVGEEDEKPIQSAERLCPRCHFTLPEGFATDKAIQVGLLGSSRSGKTTYMAVATEYLRRKLGSLNSGLELARVELLPECLKYQEALYLHQQGALGAKATAIVGELTDKMILPIIMRVKPLNESYPPFFLIFQDIPGEYLKPENDKYLINSNIPNSNELILLIDINHFIKTSQQEQRDFGGYSVQDINEIFENLETLAKVIPEGQLHSVQCTLTKLDFWMEEEAARMDGAVFAKNCDDAHREGISDERLTLVHDQISNLLNGIGGKDQSGLLDNLVKSMKLQGTHVHKGYTAIASRIVPGHEKQLLEEGADYQTSLNVLEPLMNIFEWENLLPVKKEQENL